MVTLVADMAQPKHLHAPVHQVQGASKDSPDLKERREILERQVMGILVQREIKAMLVFQV